MHPQWMIPTDCFKYREVTGLILSFTQHQPLVNRQRPSLIFQGLSVDQLTVTD